MAAFRSRLTFANVVSALALFIALGAGAYAAQKVPNDSISPRDLNFALGGDGVTKSNTIPSTGSFQPVAQTKIKVDDKGGVMQIGGSLEVDNSANGVPAQVKVQASVNSKVLPGLFTTTIPANSVGTALAMVQDNGLPAGTYIVELHAEASSVTFNDRTLSVQTSPRD